MAQVKHDLAHLTKFAINYFKKLLEKYGKGKERKTVIANFDTVEVRQVAAANEKLYVNRKEGFIGFGKDMRKEEFVSDCSDIDDIIVFRRDGIFKVMPVAEKAFVGKDIIHLAVWKKAMSVPSTTPSTATGLPGNPLPNVLPLPPSPVTRSTTSPEVHPGRRYCISAPTPMGRPSW